MGPISRGTEKVVRPVTASRVGGEAGVACSICGQQVLPTEAVCFRGIILCGVCERISALIEVRHPLYGFWKARLRRAIVRAGIP